MMNFDKDPFKSRYRGVYRCGKRWKAQLQSHGIQFYLGMFDTEEEAARAYDRKAREEKSGKNPINFEIAPEGSDHFQHRPSSPSYRYYGGGEEDDDIQLQGDFRQKYGSSGTHHNKRARNEEDQGTSDHLRRLDYQSTTENMKILWDRHCQIAQRLLLAKAAQSKLAEFQAVAPDTEKETILKALSEEIILLVVVKSQLEEAVSRCFRLGLDLNTSSVPPPAPTAKSSNGIQPFPTYHQDRRNGDAAMNGSLPSFGSNFSGSNGNSGVSTMPPYYFPQLPPFPGGVGGRSSVGAPHSGAEIGGNPFAPLRKPYVPTGATTGGYFGQTFPPSALPSLSLPSRQTAGLGPPQVSSFDTSSSTSSAFSAAAGPSQGASAPASASTQVSSGEKCLAPAEMTAVMSSFQSLTKGPSLLGNPSLLSAPDLMDNVLIGNNRLPPPPQVPLSTAAFEPVVPLNSASGLPAYAMDATPAMPAQETNSVPPIAEKQASVVVPNPILDPLSDSIDAKNAPAASVQAKAATTIPNVKATHKVVQSPQLSSGNVSAVSNKRSAAVVAEADAEASLPPKDSPKRGKGAASTNKAISFPGSDHVLFQLSAEQESAIVNAAAAASKGRSSKGAAAVHEKQQPEAEQQGKDREKEKEKEKDVPEPAVSRRSTTSATVVAAPSKDSKAVDNNNPTRRSSRR